jgi:hypothetical protein
MTINRTRAFTVAEQLAAEEVRTLVIGGGNSWESRNNHIEAVQKALFAAGQMRSRAQVQAWIEENVQDRTARIALSDAVIAAECDASEGAYLYGLALGLAIGRGGSQ